jgi:hypothetical protein
VDPSALIFVALAVAWAVYLIPKALEHHDEGIRSRTVSTFSHTLRVLARREPINRRKARLVPSAAAATKRPEPAVETAPVPRVSADVVSTDAVTSTAVLDAIPAEDPIEPAPARPVARRSAAAVAARRRRRVLGTIVVALVAVVALAALGMVAKTLVAVPVVALVAWLVACRLMVKHERGIRRPVVVGAPEKAAEPYEATIDPDTGEIAVVTAQGREVIREAGRWDPVDVPLPTYVGKPTASRRVGRLDLESTGVWSSGRSEAESALARDLDAQRAAALEEAEQRHLSERRRIAGA